ncbi:hypothetical protein PFICI_11807 [Pestalotiopsis fici W106-1]|uniref:FAD-binding PCMH-type domain-containing protein n=1 Tax=Pestalotiopsis fici (strain W106-1 / CGMCC3.15140) TaxID=1229662 RepID=W3WRC6_PESFW|nr:uncharacterized protein PFICI_11807 [Pestalotiopsis fici W106-1]ETS76420.1 hypothetical protein PFICI_11807 [Pestalotiopsis fici W106-1]
MAKGGLTRTRVQMVAVTSIATILGGMWIAASRGEPQCRAFPGSDDWPSSADWDAFNKTVGGKLIATVPVASPCHDTFPGVEHDAEECARVQDNWARPAFHDETTHSTMAAFWANNSCDPFTAVDAQCIVGAYVSYVVNASCASDYQETIKFARDNNLRLVIRNTGHDYMGKSTGAGAVAIWTHHIKDKSILDYHSAVYTGKAMKVGAGVQAAEAQSLAKSSGYVMVEGDCPTVGIAGGYTQGGGTSPLGSRFGMAADQVLEWEVVTAQGELLTATPQDNSDLYWALSGGGGGTYGVVLSMTVKLHPDAPTAGATLSFIDSSDVYWDIVQTFLQNLPTVLASGVTIYWQALPGNMFFMPQSYFPGGTAQELQSLLQPTLKALNDSGIPYAWSTQDYPAFQDAFLTLNPDMNISEVNLGGRLIPRSLVATHESASSLVDAIKSITNNGGVLAGVSMDVSQPRTVPNSVHPLWRETLFLAFLGTLYNRYNFTANIVDQQFVTTVLNPALENITAGGGAYLNEADINQPAWQTTFYGSNYAKLLSIKNKYDPDHIFWGPTAVGSEVWEPLNDGRLCRTNT